VLGPGVVRRIVISDRDMGQGFISGGLVPRTFLGDITVDDDMMRRYVYGLLVYLFRTLEKARPDLVFCSSVDNGPKWALSQVCRVLNIPFGVLAHARVGRRVLVDDSPENLYGPVRRAFEQGLSDPDSLAAYLPEARKHLERFREAPSPPPYFKDGLAWVKGAQTFQDVRERIPDISYERVISWFKAPPSLRNQKKWDVVKQRIEWTLRARKLVSRGVFSSPGFMPRRPFVYFPLHEDPESALQVMGHMHTDQVAVIEALVKSIPMGMDLVVKENPLRWGLRPYSFYKRIGKMPTVNLAWPGDSSLALIRQAALTAVISGTAAWEAILLGRPALIMGRSPFMAVGEGFVHCADLSRLPEVIAEALAIPPANDRRVELYLAALFARSFVIDPPLHGFTTHSDGPVAENRQVIQRIADGLLDIHSHFVNANRSE